LTIEGSVECDASIMEGGNTSWFGAVGMFVYLLIYLFIDLLI
jgi:isoaspartyl peptidase/L-asparaginase-like protein (Ntn-hydrolase superfamily)